RIQYAKDEIYMQNTMGELYSYSLTTFKLTLIAQHVKQFCLGKYIVYFNDLVVKPLGLYHCCIKNNHGQWLLHAPTYITYTVDEKDNEYTVFCRYMVTVYPISQIKRVFTNTHNFFFLI